MYVKLILFEKNNAIYPIGSGNFLWVFLKLPQKLRITYVQFFVLGIYFEKLSGYTDNIKRQNC